MRDKSRDADVAILEDQMKNARSEGEYREAKRALMRINAQMQNQDITYYRKQLVEAHKRSDHAKIEELEAIIKKIR